MNNETVTQRDRYRWPIFMGLDEKGRAANKAYISTILSKSNGAGWRITWADFRFAIFVGIAMFLGLLCSLSMIVH